MNVAGRPAALHTWGGRDPEAAVGFHVQTEVEERYLRSGKEELS